MLFGLSVSAIKILFTIYSMFYLYLTAHSRSYFVIQEIFPDFADKNSNNLLSYFLLLLGIFYCVVCPKSIGSLA